jgi:chromosome segregation ATPase
VRDLDNVVTVRNGLDELKYNAKEAYTYDGTLIRYRFGNKLSEINRDNYQHMFAADPRQRINALIEQIQKDKDLLERHRLGSSAIQGQLSEVLRLLKDLQIEGSSISKQISQLRNQRSRVDEKLADFKQQNAVDVTHVQAELEETQTVLNEKMELLEVENTNLEECKQIEKSHKKEKALWDKKNSESLKSIQEQRQKLELFLEHKLLAEDEVKRQRSAVSAEESSLNDLKSKLDISDAEVKRATDYAHQETLKLLGDSWDRKPLRVNKCF